MARRYIASKHPLEYITGIAGNLVVMNTNVVASFPEDSPIFTPSGEWNPAVLRSLIRVLEAELASAEAR